MDISNIFEYLCLGVCVIHAVVSWINSFRLGKKINRVCELCGSPVVEGEKHDCLPLTAFESFIKR